MDYNSLYTASGFDILYIVVLCVSDQYQLVKLNTSTEDDLFTLSGMGQFGSSSPFGPPKYDLSHALQGSGASLPLSNKEKIIITMNDFCTQSMLKKVTFVIQGSSRVTLHYINKEGNLASMNTVSIRLLHVVLSSL